MATENSASSTIAWVWAIEALASIKEVDPSFLLDLVDKGPDISDALGENAKEALYVKMLEGSSKKARGIPNNVKIGIESSESCRDILGLIYDERSGFKQKLSGAELSKYDIEPYVKHKSSCLPKSELHKLYDAILQCNHPLLAPLKEKGGLAISNEPTVNPSDNENPNGVKKVTLEELYNSQSRSVKKVTLEQLYNSQSQAIEEIIDLTSENEDIHLQRKRPHKNLSRAKRGGCFSKIGNIEGHSNGFGTHLNPTKKDKGDDVIVGQRPVSPQRVELVEANDNDNQQKIPRMDYQDSQDESGKENSQNVSLDNSKEDDIMHQEKADVVKNLEHKISSDTEDSYNVEKTNIACQKNMFLSSQLTCSPDFISEMNICMKCNQSGLLLICSSNACPIEVHENCVGSAPTFDEKGNFYCPFCAYLRAISDHRTKNEKASLALKNLRAFIGSRAQNWAKEVCDKLNGSGKDGDIDMNVDGNGGENPSSNVHPKEPLAAACNKDDDSRCRTKGKNKIDEHMGPLSNDIDIGGSSEEDIDNKSGAPEYSFRARKQENQNTFPSFAQMRRKPLHWTKEEVDKLKDGMQKFSAERDKWKLILEFGNRVFLKGRTAIDLKDKWRNICGKNP